MRQSQKTARNISRWFARMAIGVLSFSFFSAWRSQLDLLQGTHRPLSIWYWFMVSLPLFVLHSFLILGWVTLTSRRSLFLWWSSLNAATWCGMRRTWLPRRNVTGCCRRSSGSPSSSRCCRAQAWQAPCTQTSTTSLKRRERSSPSSTIMSARVGTLPAWRRRSFQATARSTMTTSDDEFANKHQYKYDSKT